MAAMPRYRRIGSLLALARLKAASAAAALVAGLWPRFGGRGWGRPRFLLPGSRFDYQREAGALWLNSTVALALAWLGDRFSRPLLCLSRIEPASGEYRPIGSNPVVDLWVRPNPHYGREVLDRAIGLSLTVDGNAYLYKVRDGRGQVAELWWIRHDRIAPMWPEDGSAFIAGYRYRVEGREWILPVEDVVHIRRGLDPDNERCGLAPLLAQLREVCTDNEASGYTACLLRNSAVPGLVVIPDAEKLRPNAEDAERIKERFADNFGGEGRGSTVVLGGKYAVEPVGFSPEQLRLDRLPLLAQAKITAAVGVAMMSLGLPDPNKTYSNLAEANRYSWGTIVAVQNLVADALRWQLLPEFGYDPLRYVIEFDYSHIIELQEDLKSKSDRVCQEYEKGIRRRGEAREELGLESGPEDDVYFVEPGGGDGPGSAPEPADALSSGPGPGPADLTKTAIEVLRDVKDALATRSGSLVAPGGLAGDRGGGGGPGTAGDRGGGDPDTDSDPWRES